MKPFYRMLTRTALVLQSVIIIYLLCQHHKDAPVGHDSCRKNPTHSAIPTGAVCNGAKSKWKSAEQKDLYVLWK